MRKIIVTEFVTLDGIVEAPNLASEYARAITALTRTGILTRLPRSENLQLTPLAMPISQLIDRVKTAVLEHAAERWAAHLMRSDSGTRNAHRSCEDGRLPAMTPQTLVDIRPWSGGDLPLLERLMGDPTMTEHLGGPETRQKIRERHERYCRIGDSGQGRMFVIIVGPGRVAAGSIGYWDRPWQGQRVWETGWSVLPEFQGQGVAARATAAVLAPARAEREYRFMHAFPSVGNGPSNAICRKVGFTLQEAVDFEYPPGHFMRCNDWRLDLFAEASAPTPA